MESFDNKKKSENNNSIVNTFKSLNPFSQTKKSLEKSNSATAFDDLNESLNKSITKKESNKPVSSIMERMSSIKPSETIKESLGKVSNLTNESIKNVSQTISTDSNISFFKILLYVLVGILLLAFVGFNLFNYLAEGTDIITNITRPVVDFIATITGNTTKTAVTNTSTGSKTIVDNLEKGTVGTVDFIQKNIKDTANMELNNSPEKTIVSTENDDSLADNKKSNNEEPEPTRTNSLSQGYCYVGKINDTRYCAKVSGRDQCMSGDIYPSMDICVNPNLRT
jgi:hypothetical protein